MKCKNDHDLKECEDYDMCEWSETHEGCKDCVKQQVAVNNDPESCGCNCHIPDPSDVWKAERDSV